MAKRNIPAGLTGLGFQRIALNSTATGLNSTCLPGSAFVFTAETQNVRLRLDGTNPTSNTGILLVAAGSPLVIDGVKGSSVKLARSAAGAIVQVQSFKHVGE